jgi:hypothetical protein
MNAWPIPAPASSVNIKYRVVLPSSRSTAICPTCGYCPTLCPNCTTLLPESSSCSDSVHKCLAGAARETCNAPRHLPGSTAAPYVYSIAHARDMGRGHMLAVGDRCAPHRTNHHLAAVTHALHACTSASLSLNPPERGQSHDRILYTYLTMHARLPGSTNGDSISGSRYHPDVPCCQPHVCSHICSWRHESGR